jgi:hypothetical protein
MTRKFLIAYISNTSALFSIYSSPNYNLIDDHPSAQVAVSKSVTVDNSPTLSENTPVKVITNSESSDLSINIQTERFSNLKALTSYSLPVNLTCSINGNTAITYALGQNGSNLLPSWVILDAPNLKLNFTTPQISQNTTYIFNIEATPNATDSIKAVYLDVVYEEKSESKEYEAPKSVKSAQIATMVSVGLSIVSGMSTSAINGASFQGIWSMINQIQLILLLPILVDFMPNYVCHFIYERVADELEINHKRLIYPV